MVEFLFQHRVKVILLALGVGAGSIVGFLPDELAPLGSNIKFVYIAIIGAAAWVFYERYVKVAKKPTYKSTVPVRNLSNPAFRGSLERRYGTREPPQINTPHGHSSPPRPQRREPAPRRAPNKDELWDTFEK